MTAAVRLIVVTDNGCEAALALFGTVPERLPDWVGVVDDLEGLMALPDGSQVLALFFPVDMGFPSLIEDIWRDRRRRGEIVGDFGALHGRVLDWHARRAESDAALIEDYRRENGAAEVAVIERDMFCRPAPAQDQPRRTRWK